MTNDQTKSRNESDDRDSFDIESRLQEMWQGAGSPAEQSPARSGQIVGQYKIRAFLGAGSFGMVYLADDIKNNCPVALKLPRLEVLLDAEKRQRFHVEADIIKRLNHDFIVGIQASGVDDSLPFIACDWCTGPDLAAYLEQLRQQGENDGNLPSWQESVRLMIKVTNAIQFAHESGITHRDIKPANILLDQVLSEESESQGLERFIPRVTDFGLARLADPVATSTRTGVLLGTPAYMSPERLIAGLAAQSEPPNHDNSVASDIYSLGAVLFELLTGSPPAGSDSWLELIRNENSVSTKELKWTQEIPSSLKNVVGVCLRNNPQARYQSAAELESDLALVIADQKPTGRPITIAEGIGWWFDSKNWALVAGLFVMVSQAILAGWLIVGDLSKVGFGLLTASQYFGLLPQLLLIAATSSLSVIACGWFCMKGFRWAPYIGIAFVAYNFAVPFKAMFGEPQVFEEIYKANSPYLTFLVHLIIALVYVLQIVLFGCAAAEAFKKSRTKVQADKTE